MRLRTGAEAYYWAFPMSGKSTRNFAKAFRVDANGGRIVRFESLPGRARDNGCRSPGPCNNLYEPLDVCSIKPMSGFYRDGCCNTGREDIGSHTVCAVMTSEFLDFSKSRGNDLSTPVPELGFPGLKPGDRSCLCAPRWQEAFEVNQAPRVVLRATHEAALAYRRLYQKSAAALGIAGLSRSSSLSIDSRARGPRRPESVTRSGRLWRPLASPGVQPGAPTYQRAGQPREPLPQPEEYIS